MKKSALCKSLEVPKSKVVRDGLRLLEEQDQQLSALRKALIAGEESGIAGPLDVERIK